MEVQKRHNRRHETYQIRWHVEAVSYHEDKDRGRAGGSVPIDQAGSKASFATSDSATGFGFHQVSWA